MPTMIQAYIGYVLQIIVAAVLLNVWLLRFNKPTQFRGKGASSMKDEFLAYGLPLWFMYMIGAAKIVIALLLIAGFWIPVLLYPAWIVLAVLMVGAISMHIKVKDPIVRTLPALGVFTTALIGLLLL